MPPPAGPVVDPGIGGFPAAGPGYFGMPAFLGPSYVPYSWVGSALGAKGDLLFPIVIFIFVVVGVWTVVQFLLGLIVPLIAAKVAVKEAIIAPKLSKGSRVFRSVQEEHQDRVESVTAAVMSALDEHENSHAYGLADHEHNGTTQAVHGNTTQAQHKHPLFAAFA